MKKIKCIGQVNIKAVVLLCFMIVFFGHFSSFIPLANNTAESSYHIRPKALMAAKMISGTDEKANLASNKVVLSAEKSGTIDNSNGKFFALIYGMVTLFILFLIIVLIVRLKHSIDIIEEERARCQNSDIRLNGEK